ncbi:CoA transferase [Kutzneria albida]|uniref:Acyl-CoA transferase/carnitine dehydratase n=1 Tax=Kutzneria albida DSM 43870 TaxID=1449976 RepID=W5W2X5_9PSEU|nr:CoA transferase [Kutzneria albida]AHH95192.1 acyl-CoA transferase/carnitine dehydratase [Kutzneria albida DSM 43870]
MKVLDTVHTRLTWAGPVDLPLHGEADVQAACGIMHVHGRRYGQPTRLALDYATLVAEELLDQGVLAAKIARIRGNPLDSVSTSVAQAALLVISQYLAAATAGDDRPEPLLPGGPPFVSSDGVRFEIESLDPFVWQCFWSVLCAEPIAVRDGWQSFLHRFATATCPLPGKLVDLVGELPFACLREVAAHTGMSIVRVLSRSPTGIPAYRLTPLPGTATLPAASATAPLAGITVLEVTRRLQGPLAGHLLTLLGAKVIRIEPPGGDLLRGAPPISGDCSARFLAVNRGKQVLRIDLNTAQGRSEVLELAAGADVFLHNWAPGKAEQRALDAGDLARVSPGIVYAWASGWGQEFGADPPLGTDYLVQAHSGLAARTPSLMTVVDIFGGLVCAHGVLDALLHKALTGEGSRVDSSLLSAAVRLSSGPLGTSSPEVPICTDLTELAADPRFAAALVREGCVFPCSPWEFST